MDTATSYDAVPYESFPYAQTHPDRLATVATLLGMKPASLRHCRVLELGCAAGGNLIPLALVCPESSFMGIDLSQVQIAAGKETVQALGLQNVELKHESILEITPEVGKFDFVICHGVYSWVPWAVQEKILEISAKNLGIGDRGHAGGDRGHAGLFCANQFSMTPILCAGLFCANQFSMTPILPRSDPPPILNSA